MQVASATKHDSNDNRGQLPQNLQFIHHLEGQGTMS